MALRTTAAVTALVLIMVAAAAVSAPAQDAAVRIATVDINKLQTGYVELQNKQAELEGWLNDQRKFFNLLTDYVFLSKDNFDEVMAILRKPTPTDQETARLTELRGVSDQKDKRYRDLEGKADRTPQEEDEYNSLQDIYKDRSKALDDMWKQTVAQLTARRDEAISALMVKVKDAIKAEAEAQGFTIVIDADAVFFGGTDITDQVLARLNAGAPAAAPAVPAAPAEGGGGQ